MIINIIQFLMSADKAEDIACKWKYARRSDSWLAWMLRCLGCLAAWDASLFRRYIVLSSVRWRLLLALPKRRQKSPEMGISIFHTHTQRKLPPSRSTPPLAHTLVSVRQKGVEEIVQQQKRKKAANCCINEATSPDLAADDTLSGNASRGRQRRPQGASGEHCPGQSRGKWGHWGVALSSLA